VVHETEAKGARDTGEQAATRPKVSVCLLTYNHRNVIASTLQSVLQQEFDDFELIVSDDRSTDGTYAELLALADSEPRLRVIQPPRNLGMAGNANFTVARARGQYIALLHHDDIYSPRLLAAWVDVLERNPTAGFVSNSYQNHHDGSIDVHPFAERNHGTKVLREVFLPSFGCPIRGTAMIRKRCWDAVGGMREELGMLADVDLWMRLAAKYDLGYVPEPLITVRHDRPDYYPDAYWRWSWSRLKLMYAIYGQHHERFYGRDSWYGSTKQAVYRARVSADIVKWLAYGIVKRRREILSSSSEVANEYELWPSVAARKLLERVSRRG
jgi:glycosyltransferase involved in cell wall biosynthesis